ncbi:hypothetical protein OSB04_026561 [Centaurea solstitialis]|uniref:DUF674 domain-containing protein n=1 Tax=Centaurea solstitialis TaxID=347529 RepID=A0AA38SPN5_9ASTR|nr:hypothetical protein OSB04_026561 [Centaurea solstitialis]
METSSKVSLKLLVDKNAKKVLFAEASKEFVDFLFYILSLPVGTVIKLLTKNSMVGSLGNLYDSIENLNDTYIQPNQNKDSILDPKIVMYGGDSFPLLLTNDDDSDEDVSIIENLHTCYSRHSYVTDDPTKSCPSCNSRMSTKVTYVGRSNAVKKTTEGGGFVKGVVTYMVMDDLVVKPMSTISSITMLNKFNVKEVGGLEEKVVSFDMKEVGIDVAQGIIRVQECAYNCVFGLMKLRTKMAADSASSKVSLKLLIDKKAQKVLFAESNKEFVDFLFHVLSLPLGTVIKLLTKNAMVGSLGNLYDSVENLNDTYIQPNQNKESILNPKIANYGAEVPLLLPCNNHVPMAKKFYTCSCRESVTYDIYSSSVRSTSILYVADDSTAVCPLCKACMSKAVTYVAGSGAAKVKAEGGGFVKGVVTYMIMDDLEVKPMSTISSITMLTKFNVKEIGSLEEKVVSFDMNEGLMLLKASLECKNVLTTVFLRKGDVRSVA